MRRRRTLAARGCRRSGFAVAKFLRDDAQLKLDYCSNVTGVDWPDKEITEKIKVKKVVDGVEKEVEEVKKTARPGYLEVVYHLYSMGLKHGPVVLRMRTENRADQNASAVAHAGLARRGISGARNLRLVWRHFRRASRPAPDIDVGRATRAIRCAGITSRRTILNTSRRRTTRCWRRQKNIIRSDQRRR